ncbi:unnamed protein product, partial [Rotaria socialis]
MADYLSRSPVEAAEEDIDERIQYESKFTQTDLPLPSLNKKQQLPLASVPFVPAGRIRVDILKNYHDAPGNGAHFGRDKTTRKIQERYYWPTMITDIRNHLNSCLPCAQNNHRRQKLP